MKKYYEDEEEKHPRLRLMLVGGITAAIMLAAIIGAWAITYVLQTSPPQNVEVTGSTVGVPVTLTLNATTLTELDTLTLTATTGPNGAGLTVHFYDGATDKGTAVIQNVGGVYKATKDISGLTVGTHVFTAGP